MSVILAIDPGNHESAYCAIFSDDRHPNVFGKIRNGDLLTLLRRGDLSGDNVAIEMVAAYGMAVGADVFETCVWIGRFAEALVQAPNGVEPSLIKRQPVKLHHCHSAKAKDTNVRQALIDRFGQGASNGGKGTKADPGWFYGFAADVWSAYAIAVFVADQQAQVDPYLRSVDA